MLSVLMTEIHAFNKLTNWNIDNVEPFDGFVGVFFAVFIEMMLHDVMMCFTPI